MVRLVGKRWSLASRSRVKLRSVSKVTTGRTIFEILNRLWVSRDAIAVTDQKTIHMFLGKRLRNSIITSTHRMRNCAVNTTKKSQAAMAWA